MAAVDGKRDHADLFHYIRVVIGILGLVLAALMCWFGYQLGREIFTDEALTTKRTEHVAYTLTVEKGESSLAVGMELREAGVIRSALAFAIQTKIYQCRIEAGEYNVSSRQSSKAIAKYLNDEYVKAHAEDIQ